LNRLHRLRQKALSNKLHVELREVIARCRRSHPLIWKRLIKRSSDRLSRLAHAIAKIRREMNFAILPVESTFKVHGRPRTIARKWIVAGLIQIDRQRNRSTNRFLFMKLILRQKTNVVQTGRGKLRPWCATPEPADREESRNSSPFQDGSSDRRQNRNP